MKNLNMVAKRHYEWVEEMGWHNKTVLESLALIGSEIGEATAECLQNSSHFAEELADIFLRCADLAYDKGVDLDELLDVSAVSSISLEDIKDIYPGDTLSVLDGVATKDSREKTIKTIHMMAQLTVEWSLWVNTARKAHLDESFKLHMGRVLQGVFDIAEILDINLERCIIEKIEKNMIRGTRGRIV